MNMQEALCDKWIGRTEQVIDILVDRQTEKYMDE